MKKSVLSLSILFVTITAWADSISMQNGGTFSNTSAVADNLAYKKEKAESAMKIAKLEIAATSSQRRKDFLTIQAVTNAAKKANALDISKADKRQKCIRKSLSFGWIQVDTKLAKKECEEIF